jgi:hypothetical protein
MGDLSYPVRILRKSPPFKTAAVLTQALGIGANIPIVQLLHAVRLQPQVKDQQQLIEIRISDMAGGRTRTFAWRRLFLTNALWEPIRDCEEDSLGVYAWGATPFDLSAAGEPRFTEGLWAT